MNRKIITTKHIPIEALTFCQSNKKNTIEKSVKDMLTNKNILSRLDKSSQSNLMIINMKISKS